MLHNIEFKYKGDVFYTLWCSLHEKNKQYIYNENEWLTKCQETEYVRAGYLDIQPKRCIQIIKIKKNKLQAIFAK